MNIYDVGAIFCFLFSFIAVLKGMLWDATWWEVILAATKFLGVIAIIILGVYLTYLSSKY